MKNEMFKLRLDPILDFRRLITTGVLEFDRSPDLLKPLPTDSYLYSVPSKCSMFFPCSDLLQKADIGEKRREKF